MGESNRRKAHMVKSGFDPQAQYRPYKFRIPERLPENERGFRAVAPGEHRIYSAAETKQAMLREEPFFMNVIFTPIGAQVIVFSEKFGWRHESDRFDIPEDHPRLVSETERILRPLGFDKADYVEMPIIMDDGTSHTHVRTLSFKMS